VTFKNPFLVEHLHRQQKKEDALIGRSDMEVDAVLSQMPCVASTAGWKAASWKRTEQQQQQSHAISSTDAQNVVQTASLFRIDAGGVFGPLAASGTLRMAFTRRSDSTPQQCGDDVSSFPSSNTLEGAVRIARLFEPVPASAQVHEAKDEAGNQCSGCRRKGGVADSAHAAAQDTLHPLPPGVTANLRQNQSNKARGRKGSLDAEGDLREVQLHFELQQLVDSSDLGPVALYEIRGSQIQQPCGSSDPALYGLGAWTETITAVFAAHGMHVVGDASAYHPQLHSAVRDVGNTFLRPQLLQKATTAAQMHAAQRMPSEALTLAASMPLSPLARSRCFLPLLGSVDKDAMSSLQHATQEALWKAAGGDEVATHVVRGLTIASGPCIVRSRLVVPNVDDRETMSRLHHWKLQLVAAGDKKRSVIEAPAMPSERLTFDASFRPMLCPEFLISLMNIEAPDRHSGWLPHLPAEETGVLVCGVCGSFDHVQQHCTAQDPSAVSMKAVALAAATPSISEIKTEREMVETSSLPPAPSLNDDDSERLPGSVAELRQWIERGAQQKRRGASFQDDTDGDVVRIPNERATKAVTAAVSAHSIRQRQKTPHLHRRKLTCAFCHGPHHIANCPKLEGGAQVDEGGGDTSPGVDTSSPSPSSSALPFCIRCGEVGHMYLACPTIPAGLHTATHCCICHVAKAKVLHTPTTCPKRHSVPNNRQFASDGSVMQRLRDQGRPLRGIGRRGGRGESGQAHGYARAGSGGHHEQLQQSCQQ